MRSAQLYDYERPIAQQSAILANQQRDPKKQQKPYTLDDFALYRPTDADGTPDGAYGSAMVELVKARKCPPWALFCYKQLVAAADPDYVPTKPALIGEGAILLHPTETPEGYKGLLIAMEQASGERMMFTALDGSTAILSVPVIGTKVVAQEDVVLLK